MNLFLVRSTSRVLSQPHRRNQGFCLGGGPPGRCHPALHTFEALAGSWGSVSVPAVSRIMGGAQSEKELQKNVGEMTFGEVFLMLSA